MIHDKQKILFIDLETSPNISYTWGKWEQDVIEFLEEGHLLCFSYKWLGEKTVHSLSMPDFKCYKFDKKSDFQLVAELHKLFEKADIICGHNAISFDIKMANRFFLKNGLPPVSEYKIVDTKVLAKSKFRFNSNKLDELGNYLGLGRKLHTEGFALWKGCMSGDMKSWDKMVKYNKQDVLLLEKVYDKLVPWCKHPIVYVDNKCHVCGSDNIIHRGYSYQDSGKSRKPKMVCKNCLRWTLGNLEKI